MSYTRKNRQRGAGFFDFFRTKTVNSNSLNLKAQRNYNLAHSKSRMTNILKTPGQFTYTNKEAIQSKYKKAIQELQQVEKPQETVSALQTLSTSLETALKSQRARETGAVVITIPIGMAQLAIKALRLFLSALVIIFVDLPLGIMAGSPAVNMAAGVAPNTRFNTTASMYRKARGFTGANRRNNVAEYR